MSGRVALQEGQLLNKSQPEQSTFLTAEDFSKFIADLQRSREGTEDIVRNVPTATDKRRIDELYFEILDDFNARAVGLRSCKEALRNKFSQLEKEKEKIKTEAPIEKRIDAELLEEQIKLKKCFVDVVDREMKREEELKVHAMEVLLASVITRVPPESSP